MAVKPRVIFCLIIITLTFGKIEGQICITNFLAQPGAHVNAATLNCNLQGSTVQIMCSIPVVGFRLIWHYTNNPTQVGTSTGTVLNITDVTGNECNITSCALVNAANSITTSTLTIKSFSDSNAGYYWCERSSQSSNSPYVVLPSQIVNIQEAPEGVATCLNGVYAFTVQTPGNTTSNCAFGDSSLRTNTITIGIRYTSSTPTASTTVATTLAPTTQVTTVKETTETMAVEVVTTDGTVDRMQSSLTLLLCVVFGMSHVM